MRTEQINVEAFTIHDAKALDPIRVIMQDIGPRQGRLIVECFGQAWSAYWGGMGDRTLREFLISCNASYIANKLTPPYRLKKSDEAYLMRVVEAVHMALCMEVVS
jgi:hypothetical protein